MEYLSNRLQPQSQEGIKPNPGPLGPKTILTFVCLNFTGVLARYRFGVKAVIIRSTWRSILLNIRLDNGAPFDFDRGDRTLSARLSEYGATNFSLSESPFIACLEKTRRSSSSFAFSPSSKWTSKQASKQPLVSQKLNAPAWKSHKALAFQSIHERVTSTWRVNLSDIEMN